MKYDRVLVYTKKGDLLDYLFTDKVICSYPHGVNETTRDCYAREREIQLVVSARWEDFPVSTRKGIVQMTKCFCRIKCPVNPLPVKGEFEVPNLECLRRFLKANGWELKQDMGSGWFK
jgi:hypothetical protein